MDAITIKIFTPEIFLSFCILTTLVFNSYVITSPVYNMPIFDREGFNQVLFIIFLTFCLVLNSCVNSFTPSLLFVVDFSSQNTKLIVLFALFCSFLLGQNFFYKNKVNLFEFFAIALLALLSLMLLSSSLDLISLYIALEMQSLCLYILAAFNRRSAFSTEAGLKYFILGAFASGLYLFGASILYGVSGSTNLQAYALLFSLDFFGNSSLNTSVLYLGVLLVLVTFLFKVAAAPFHVWSPDVYEGAPLNSTLIFVLVPKAVFFLLIFRLLYYSFYSFFTDFQTILLISGILSVLLGSLLALKQKRLKRLLIYSSISHVGYMLIGCATGTLFGLTSVFFYIIFYIVTSITIWGSFFMFQYYSEKGVFISELSGLAKKNSALALSFSLSLFSLAGIPPLVGFSMKFFLFSAALNAHLYEVSAIVLILSVLGSFYYLRLIKIIYFETALHGLNFTIKPVLHGQDSYFVLISCSLIVIVLVFVDPTFFFLCSYKTILGLCFI